VGAVATNPLPHPPPPGVPGTLVTFTNCSVKTYADLNGIGINPPPNASWSVQKQVDRCPRPPKQASTATHSTSRSTATGPSARDRRAAGQSPSQTRRAWRPDWKEAVAFLLAA
jgi:hypothetical protein